MKTTLKKLSVCECGCPLLKTSIPLGTEYEIFDSVRKLMNFRCGKCGTWFEIECILVGRRGPSHGGYLPAAAFTDEPVVRRIIQGPKPNPVAWSDEAGVLHLSLPEILRQLGLEETPENLARTEKLLEEHLKELAPQAKIEKVD